MLLYGVNLVLRVGMSAVYAVLFVAALLEELGSYLREHCVSEHILFLLSPLCALLLEFIKLRLEEVGGAAGYRLFALEYHLLE